MPPSFFRALAKTLQKVGSSNRSGAVAIIHCISDLVQCLNGWINLRLQSTRDQRQRSPPPHPETGTATEENVTCHMTYTFQSYHLIG